MKKVTFCAVILVCCYLLSGCGGKNITLDNSKVKENTILIRKDGSIQSAVIEDFDKEYYSKEGLEKFIDKEVARYNKQNPVKDEKNPLVKKESLIVRDNKAIVIFTYASVGDYCKFNNVKADKMTVSEAEEKKLIPEKLTSAKDASMVEKEKVLEKGKYHIVFINEKYNVRVQGTIKYFSGAQLLNRSTVQTKSEDASIVIYK